MKRKKHQEFHFRVRTVEIDSAKEGKEFKKYDQIETLGVNQDEISIMVDIIDNQSYQPDLEFEVHILDIDGNPLTGDDTKTVITILDEDDPGKLSFEETDIKVTKTMGKVAVKVRRDEGTDGRISCVLKTADFFET